MQRCSPFLLALAALAISADGSASAHDGKISPALDPKSDKKFFGPPFPADYPDDAANKGAAVVMHNFSIPYPKAQGSDTYDSDFVRDSNSDNGEWKAQLDYDRLRKKLAKKQEDAKVAEAKMGKEKHGYDEASREAGTKEEEFDQAAREGQERAAEAAAGDARVEEAARRLRRAKAAEDVGHPGGELPMQDEVAAARKVVEKEMKDVEECEKQLADAQRELKEVLARQEEAQAKQAGAAAAKKEKAHSQEQEKEKLLEQAEAEKVSSDAKLKEAHKNKESKKGPLDLALEKESEEKRDFDDAKKAYEQEASELKKMEENDLAAAEAKLRSIRGGGTAKAAPHPDPPEKSGTAALAAPLSLAALLAFATAAA